MAGDGGWGEGTGNIYVLVLRWGGAENKEKEVSHGSDITEEERKDPKHHMDEDKKTGDDTDANAHGANGTED